VNAKRADELGFINKQLQQNTLDEMFSKPYVAPTTGIWRRGGA